MKSYTILITNGANVERYVGQGSRLDICVARAVRQWRAVNKHARLASFNIRVEEPLSDNTKQTNTALNGGWPKGR